MLADRSLWTPACLLRSRPAMVPGDVDGCWRSAVVTVAPPVADAPPRPRVMCSVF